MCLTPGQTAGARATHSRADVRTALIDDSVEASVRVEVACAAVREQAGVSMCLVDSGAAAAAIASLTAMYPPEEVPIVLYGLLDLTRPRKQLGQLTQLRDMRTGGSRTWELSRIWRYVSALA